jgi:hypothetical protein
MKSTEPIRIHLNIPGQQSRRSSFDLNHISSLPTTVTITKDKLTTNIDSGPRAGRFSHVSSSYAQFLKQRDMDKVKKIVSDFIKIRP